MLKKFRGVPVIVRRGQSGAFSGLGVLWDSFRSWLEDLGYAPKSIDQKSWVIEMLGRWMARGRLVVTDLDERRVEAFLGALRRRGFSSHGFRRTLHQWLAHLRTAGAVPTPVAPRDDSPAAVLVASYEGHLRRERALAAVTVAGYLPIVRAFVAEHLRGGAVLPEVLHARAVRDFLLARVRRVAPRRAQFVGTALRSFLRFLFLRGHTGTDLALAVPTVRQWRLSSVPRYLPARDVERLLEACDFSSATGRRDHAILLLLARLGLRAGEVVALELGDLRWREGEIVVRGKRMVRDRLPLVPDVGEALALYLRQGRRPGRSRRLFLCRRAPHRGFSNPTTVSTIVRRALARAGLAPPTRGAHLLRHSLATAMVRRGASLAEIGQVLRHRSPNSTEIYAKLDFGSLRDVALPWPTARGAR